MRLSGALISAMFLSIMPQVNAEEKSEAAEPSTVTISGLVDFGMGEVMAGNYRAVRTGNSGEWTQYPHLTSHQWFGNPLTRLNLDFKPTEKLTVRIGFEGNIFINTFPPEYKSEQASNGGSPLMPPFVGLAVHQAQGIFSFINNDAQSLSLSLGYFPYKYNPDVRNLGEFLFRSGTYPFFLVNDFNFPLARLSGSLLHYTRGSEEDFKISADQFLRVERNFAPLNDFSLSTIAGCTWKKIIDASVGIDFSRLIPVNDDLTTPEGAAYPSAVDTMKDDAGAPILDGNGYVQYIPRDTSGYYTFKGIKCMARATIDPFGMMRGHDDGFVSRLLGANGGKVYGEVAVIGLKNYPANPLFKGCNNVQQAQDQDNVYQINPWGYASISERMPWMVGVNIPLWKILDVCAFELERYPAPYPNDVFQCLYNDALPIPSWSPYYRKDTISTDPNTGDPVLNPLGMDEYSGHRWYWSLYMQRKIGNSISVYAQVARDHARWEVNLGNEFNYTSEEIMGRTGDWSWRLGMLLAF
jgi:hypothetical protein